MKYDSYARKGEQVSVGNFLRKDHRNSALHNLDFFFGGWEGRLIVFTIVYLSRTRLRTIYFFPSYCICVAAKTFTVVWIQEEKQGSILTGCTALLVGRYTAFKLN